MKKTSCPSRIALIALAVLVQFALAASPTWAFANDEPTDPDTLVVDSQPQAVVDDEVEAAVAPQQEDPVPPATITDDVADSVPDDADLPSDQDETPAPSEEDPTVGDDQPEPAETLVDQPEAASGTNPEDDANGQPEGTVEQPTSAPAATGTATPAQPKAAMVAQSTTASKQAQPTSAIKKVTVATLSKQGDSLKVLDLCRSSSAENASFLMFRSNSKANQRFRFEPVSGTQYCLIYSVSSNKALTIVGTLSNRGARVVQRASKNTLEQQWLIAKEGGYYLFYSAQALKAGLKLVLSLDEKAKRLMAYDAASGKAGRWAIHDTRTIADGTYVLSPNVSGSKALDLTRGDLRRGTNIESYATNNGNAQRFYVAYNTRTGYYTISNVASGHALDVAKESTRRGASVVQWTYSGAANQQWSIERSVSGMYRIVARHSGLVLSVKGGSSKNCADVVQAAFTTGRGQRWKLTSINPIADGCYSIAAFASQGLCIDVCGGVGERYTNVILYKKKGNLAQKYEVFHYGKGLYTIRTLTSGLYVGTLGASPKAGANIWVEGGTTMTDGCLWKPIPSARGLSFVSAAGLALDIQYGKVKSGANIIGWRPNGGKNQHFALAKAGGALLGLTQFTATIPTQSSGSKPQVTSTRIDGKTYLFLPSCTDKTRVQLRYMPMRLGKGAQVATTERGSYTTLGQNATINLTKGFKRDATGAYVVWVRCAGAHYTRPVRVMVSQGIRSMYLTSSHSVAKGRSWVDAATRTNKRATDGSMVLLDKGGKVAYDGKLTQIKGRGNSTWEMPKKPYQIKLDKKTSLLDSSDANKSKTWVLLANYLDTTMERDYLAKKLALELGLKQTPDSEYVDLYYDGAYRGTYQLGEKVQIGKGRVNIYDLEEENEKLNGSTASHKTGSGTNAYGQPFQYVKNVKNPSDITGGYLLEMDPGNYKEERSWFKTTAGYFVVKGPEDASYNQVKYISEYVQRAVNEASKAGGDLKKYMDVDSLAKVSLVNEVTKNPDWIQWSSTFFYKDKGSVLYAGPVWDFDLSCGVARQDEERKYAQMATEGLIHQEYGFFANNNQFKSALKSAFKNNTAKVKALTAGGSSGKGKVGDTAQLLATTWQMNRLVWPYKKTIYVPLDLSNRNNAVEHLHYWLAARSNWLNNHFTGSTQPLVDLGSALSGTFTIKAGTGRMLYTLGRSDASGADIVTWGANGSNYQKFRLKAVGKNESGEWYYTITNVGSGKVLAAEGGSTRLTANVCQETPNGSTAQYWILRRTSPASTGRYQIVNLKSRLSLDVGGGDNYNGATVLLYLLSGNNAAQNWTLKKL